MSSPRGPLQLAGVLRLSTSERPASAAAPGLETNHRSPPPLGCQEAPRSPTFTISLARGTGDLEGSAARLLDALCPACPGPETTHHGGICVHQHGAGSVGREAWRRHSPRPTARRELEPGALAARGDHCPEAEGKSAESSERMDGVLSGGRPRVRPWRWAGPELVALGKKSGNGCPAPAL